MDKQKKRMFENVGFAQQVTYIMHATDIMYSYGGMYLCYACRVTKLIVNSSSPPI